MKSVVTLPMLLKLIAIISIYVMILWDQGMIGILAALIAGTTSAIILQIARQQDIVPLIRLTTCTLLGAAASGFLPVIGRNADTQFLMQTVVFSLIGAFVGMIFNLQDRPASTQPRADTAERNRESPCPNSPPPSTSPAPGSSTGTSSSRIPTTSAVGRI